MATSEESELVGDIRETASAVAQELRRLDRLVRKARSSGTALTIFTHEELERFRKIASGKSVFEMVGLLAKPGATNRTQAEAHQEILRLAELEREEKRRAAETSFFTSED